MNLILEEIDDPVTTEKRRLLRLARDGDVGALCVLYELYRLRLPLVEARLRLPLPWLARPVGTQGLRASAMPLGAQSAFGGPLGPRASSRGPCVRGRAGGRHPRPAASRRPPGR